LAAGLARTVEAAECRSTPGRCRSDELSLKLLQSHSCFLRNMRPIGFTLELSLF
jgi:hypothetical protein